MNDNGMATPNDSLDAPPKAKKSTRKKTGTDLPPHLDVSALQKPVRLLSAPQVMLHLHNEHKYMTKLINVLHEQLAMIDVGQTPDFRLMHDVTHYMHTYSDDKHHPREDIIYRKLAQRDPSFSNEVDGLLIEHETMSRKTETLLNSLADAAQSPSLELAGKLRFRCEDYTSMLSNHMDMEESQIFPRIRAVLTEDDWTDIIHEIQPPNDPLFGAEVEKRYQELFHAISDEMGRAADEFTVAEFIGLHAAMENIGLIARYTNQIGTVLGKHFRHAYRGNAVAYRKLMKSGSRSPGDYFSVTVDCALNNFDTYTETLRDVGRILRKARSQIAEPYTARLRIYHETSRLPSPNKEESGA